MRILQRSHVAVVATLVALACSDMGPVLDSPQIAFTSDRDGNWEVYVMTADGSAQTRLTNNVISDYAPVTWSPDGSRIAVSDGGVYVMNADGSAPTRLADQAVSPAWSPDGQKIAFASGRDGNIEIYVMNADGSTPTRLTNNTLFDDVPAWSPDGQRIAFASNVELGVPYNPGDNREIFVMNADGSGLTRLTDNVEYDDLPDWSPDGAKIAFVSGRDGVHTFYVMNADGSTQTRLTNDALAQGYSPDWSPDGRKIAFTCYPNPPRAAPCVMNADGTGATVITDNPWHDVAPRWRP